ncbi:MAG: DUF2058 family protein [Gammaproteobacteria bacterium]|nr:DUF2058 family protein [Gammaproteobacteria bacterium]
MGRLAIVMLPGNEMLYEVVPTGVANKISQRNEVFVVQVNDKPESDQDGSQGEDDPYAQYEVPDDLMW